MGHDSHLCRYTAVVQHLHDSATAAASAAAAADTGARTVRRTVAAVELEPGRIKDIPHSVQELTHSCDRCNVLYTACDIYLYIQIGLCLPSFRSRSMCLPAAQRHPSP